MKLYNHFKFLITITIIFFVFCNADLIDESESFCSTDPEGSCTIPSGHTVVNPFQGIQNLFSKFYLGYADRIRNITKIKNERRDAEFAIQEGSGIEKITSNNYQKLINGTWLVQIYSPWCPYSLHFQRTWREVVKDVKHRSKLISDGVKSFEEEQKILNDDKSNKEKEENYEELKIKKRDIIKNMKFAIVDANESIDVAALLEVKGFPTIKILHKGNVVTYTNSTSYERLIKFTMEDWMKKEWYNRLPKTPSKLYQLQLQFSLFLYKILYHLDINIFVPLKYVTFTVFIYLAYSINILGKIRYGLIHVRQYISAFVPEILDIE